MSLAAPTVSAEQFVDLVVRSEHLVVDFFAPWCAPCQMMAPHFERIARRHADMTFVKVDTDEHPELAAALDIQSLPTIMVFRQGVWLCTEVGNQSPGSLRQLVGKTQKIDMDAVHAAAVYPMSES
ncbi:MAG TPA: thioredoxin [Myxococcales bacterium]|nr:thioredoxin [Myxococcales bacterium]HAN31554.1 thioredoxin [Myxococcales bacterium]